MVLTFFSIYLYVANDMNTKYNDIKYSQWNKDNFSISKEGRGTVLIIDIKEEKFVCYELKKEWKGSVKSFR